MKKTKVAKMAGIIVLTPLAFAAISGIVMLLWNALLPQLFKMPVIGFWQAAGLMMLSRLLFGRRGVRFGDWRHRLRERAEQMSAEERERLREGLRRSDRALGE